MSTDEPTGQWSAQPEPDEEPVTGVPRVYDAPSLQISGDEDLAEDGPQEAEAGDEPDEAAVIRATYELRSRVEDELLGVIPDEVWDRAVDAVLDQHWPEEG